MSESGKSGSTGISSSARNMTAFLLHLIKDGKLQLNPDDEIVRDTLLTHDGEIKQARVREFFSLTALATADRS